MSWVRFDDKAPRHPKVAGLSDKAFRVMVSAICYASEFMTDGIVPAAFLASVRQSVQQELISGGLWRLHEAQIHIHDYQDYQLTKAEIERRRKDSADRVERHRSRVSNALQDEKKRGSNSAPSTSQVHPIPIVPAQNAGTGTRARGLITSPLAYDRLHGKHVTGFCDFVCFPESVFDGFVSRVVAAGGATEDVARVQVRQWAEVVRAAWRGQIPGDDIFAFWRHEWAKTHGSNRPTSAGVDVTAGLRDA